MKLSVQGTLRNNDDGLAFANFSMLVKRTQLGITKKLHLSGPIAYAGYDIAHFILPFTCFSRLFGDEDEVSSGTSSNLVSALDSNHLRGTTSPNSSHKRKPATMSTHNFNNKSARMRASSSADVVN